MEEKRRYKRLPLKLELTISTLFKQDYETIENINEGISVKNLSKSGIGFTCKNELPANYYFDADIQLSEDEHFFSVLKIVRVQKLENEYFIGCEFVGLADILRSRVDTYEKHIEAEQKQDI